MKPPDGLVETGLENVESVFRQLVALIYQGYPSPPSTNFSSTPAKERRPGATSPGLRNLAAIQMLYYLYEEPEYDEVGHHIISAENARFSFWCECLGWDPEPFAKLLLACDARIHPPKRKVYIRSLG